MKRKMLATAAVFMLTAQMAHAEADKPAGSNEIQEVVVTAQRREERLTDVPMSITALTAEKLAASGVGTTQDLTLVTPGLFWARSTAYSQPTIRGVGTRNTGPGDEPNIATYIDGVYQPDSTSTIMELANIERIEVLKGPQGTLFGRNATGGVVNIITQRPSFDIHAKSDITVGGFGQFKATGLLTGPLIADKLAGSLSAVVNADGGYIRNVYLGTKQGKHNAVAVRAKLLFTPTENLEIQLNGLYSKDKDNVSLSGQSLNGNGQARRTAATSGIPIDILIPLGTRTTAVQYVPYNNTDHQMVDLHVTYDMPWARLATLASWSEGRTFSLSDSDASPLNLVNTDRDLPTMSWNEQAILSSVGDGRLSWMAGVEGFQGKSDLALISGGAATRGGQRTRSVSGFAEATLEIIDNLYLTGGLRYTEDTKRSYYAAVAPTAVLHAEAKYNNTVPRVVLRYKPTERSSIYASYTEGFKSGTFNATGADGAVIAARPEQIKAYEVGGKAAIGPATFSASAFDYDYTDLQTSVQTTLTTATGTRAVTLLQNAPAAKIKGLEFSGDLRATDRLSLSTGISILDAKITDFPNATVVTPVFTNGLPAGGANSVVNVSGKRLIRAPKYTFNVGATYTIPVMDGDLALNTTVFISDKFYIDLLNRVAQPRYTIVNASATWTAPGGAWKIGVFGQNLANQKYFAANTISVFSDTITYAKPRWFGVTVGFNY